MGKNYFLKAWNVVEIPFYVLLLWQILSVVLTLQGIFKSGDLRIMFLGISVLILIGIFAGYKSYSVDKNYISAVKYCAMLALFGGIVAALISLVSFFVFPAMYEVSIQEAVKAGAPESTIRSFMIIGLFIQFVIVPVFYSIIFIPTGLIGAFMKNKI